MQVDRVDNVCWLFGLEGLARSAAWRRSNWTTSRCGRRAHELTHLPARSWCEKCVKSFGSEDPHRRRRGGRDQPELHVDYMFMGRRDEKELICALHAIDTEFLARTVIRADTDYVFHGILSSSARSEGRGS